MFLSVRSHELLPRKRRKFIILASEWRIVFLSGSPLHQGYNPRSDRKNVSNAFVFDPVGSKKYWQWFPETGPLGKRETALDKSWRKLQLILRRGRPISNIFEARAHANVLKATFSTDCKSNFIRIGLRLLKRIGRMQSQRYIVWPSWSRNYAVSPSGYDVYIKTRSD